LAGITFFLRRRAARVSSQEQAICDAAARGDLDSVRWFHQHGTCIRARNDEPLCRACEGGHLDIVRYLHQNGAELNAGNAEPLCRACDAGHLGILRYLHENGVDLYARNDEPLCRAAAAGHLEVVRYIHQNGGNIQALCNEPLRRAAARGRVPVVQYLHNAGAATKLLSVEARQLIEEMRQELHKAPAVDQPSEFWKNLSQINEQVLDWGGEANFKRTLNQNYFNFIPTAPNDARMVRMGRLMRHLPRSTLDLYDIEDPDGDPASWISCYPDYYIFKEPDRAKKRELYRGYLGLIYEYALQRDRSGLLAKLDEPTLGNPIRVYRKGRLISQDIVNSLRERNSILAAIGADGSTRFTLAEFGAGYGRLGYLLLETTTCRYFVFDIPPALYLSQWYLTTLFPGRRVFRFRRFERFEEVKDELSRTDIAFFTPNQLTKFPSGYFDVSVAISSMHEMRHDQIRHYMALLGRTTRYALYLKQQKGYVNPVDNLVIGKDDYPIPFGWAPTNERFDLINPGFFERVYQRCQTLSSVDN
jgi:putative sugar O-methyltransferase